MSNFAVFFESRNKIDFRYMQLQNITIAKKGPNKPQGPKMDLNKKSITEEINV